MLLSSFERADSPFVRLQYGAADGRKRYVKTSIRKDDPDKVHKVQVALNRLEAQMLAAGDDNAPGSGDWRWVGVYLRQRYAARRATLKQYTILWRSLARFVIEHEIAGRGAFQREHAFAYLDWRQSQVKQKSRRSPGLNTALGELKLMGLILDEAIARGMAVEPNPARKLAVEKQPKREKEAFTDEQIVRIYAALKEEPAWMQRAFHVALHTGLRHAETQLRREAVRWERREVEIIPKGGMKKRYTVPLPPALDDMLGAWLATRAPRLWEPPAGVLMGIAWTKLWRRLGIPNVDFHSTRRTFITRGALAGIPESAMMRLVNHASQEVHRIYQRFAASDLHTFQARVVLPVPTP